MLLLFQIYFQVKGMQTTKNIMEENSNWQYP